MITLDAIRTAVLAADPYMRMDELVRAELAAGRKVREVFDAVGPLVDAVLDTPGLTADGEEAFLGALDALTGGCHPDSNYTDPPTNGRPDLPADRAPSETPPWSLPK